MSAYKTFNVGFMHTREDETQFQIHAGTPESEIKELGQLLLDFFTENGFVNPHINYIKEVPYDGDDK